MTANAHMLVTPTIRPSTPDVAIPAPATRRQADLFLGDVGLLLAFTALLFGFIDPKLSTLIQMVLAAVFILLADVRLVPALMALQFTVTDFQGGVAASMETQYERYEGMVIVIGGLPFTANYVLLLAVLVRVLYDVLTQPRLLRGPLGIPSVLVWLSTMVLAIHNSLLGRALGNPSWSAPARITLAIGALWLGAVLAKDRSLLLQVLRRRIAPFVIVVLGLAFCEMVVNRLTWLLVALGITLAVDAFFNADRGGRKPIRAMLLLFLSLAIGFGLRATPAMLELARQRGGSFAATLTTMLVPVLTGGLVWLCRPRRGSLADRSRPGSAVLVTTTVLYLAFCAFPFIISALTINMDVETRGREENISLRERVAYKLFFERAAIWRGSIDQISQPPYVFVPSGRDGYLITNAGRSGKFIVGSHNMVLECLRSGGLLAGLVTLGFFYMSVVAAAVACFVRPDAVGRILGPALIAVTIGTGVSGASVLDPTLGFFTLLFGGMCMGGNLVSRSSPMHPARA
jgi:hypothetical protein